MEKPSGRIYLEEVVVNQKRAIIMFIEGFEEVEALTVVDYFSRAKIAVTKAGVETKMVKGRSGISVEMDGLLSEYANDLSTYDCLVIPGGPGAQNLVNFEPVKATASYFFEHNKLVGAICAAPVVLLNKLGYLKGRNFTCFTGLEKEVIDGRYQSLPVVVDKNLITSMAMGTSAEFADALVTALVDAQTSRLIAENTRQFWIRDLN